jgi:Skp family chaperone for outer membrane proteins
MRLFGYVVAAAVAVAAVGVSVDAFAQRNRNQGGTVVLNYQRVVAESALGRDMGAKLAQIRQQVAQEAQALQPEGASLEQERQRLAQASRNMSPEQIRNSASLAPQVQQFSQRLQQFQARQQGLQGDFECSQAFALRDFERLSSPVVQSVMASRGAGVVLDTGSIVHASPDLDITNTVIQQLDQNPATRTATVARHAVAECAPQQAPAQQ